MAKGKNLNPADAFRKALRKKELKKNKAERSKARDFSLVKKDTTDLEEEVERLEFATEAKDKARYVEAKAELERIYQKKEEYLKEHPDQRRLVYRKKDGDKPNEEIVLQKRNFFDKNGLPRHPERSIYYDPVMNPFGVAPPGMPYQERPRNPGEVYSDDSDDDDDDIAMPEGPPPDSGEEDGSDDDIPMPEGPPPGQLTSTSSLPPPPPSLPPHPPPPAMALPGSLPPRPSNFPLPPPPPGGPPNTLPPRPPGFPGASFPSGFPAYGGFAPPAAFPNFPPQGLPPPPPGFFPTRNQSSLQDPLSSVPHQTFQARAAGYALPPKPSSVAPPASASLPPKPVAAVSSANLMSATVFAAPELRDFKKEATAFVPSNVKRKKAATASGSSTRVNAAPSLSALPSKPGASGPTAEESLPVRPDLLGSLKGKFGTPPAAPAKVAKTPAVKDAKQKDDYDKFVESMADILGPK
ncbi:mRNA biogenesis factor-domain-containing protein [Mycena galericulata]|nr:mRNA biogenesis factor-domain-containing protein [Mycena galericulata]